LALACRREAFAQLCGSMDLQVGSNQGMHMLIVHRLERRLRLLDINQLVDGLNGLHQAGYQAINLGHSAFHADELLPRSKCPPFRLGHKIAAATLRLAVPQWLSSTIPSSEDKAHRVYEAMIAFTWVAEGLTMEGFTEHNSRILLAISGDLAELPYPPPLVWSVEGLVERLMPPCPVPQPTLQWDPSPVQQVHLDELD
ncbi:unnamed protein product, partial [Symbiodinium sp. CCMP2456]